MVIKSSTATSNNTFPPLPTRKSADWVAFRAEVQSISVEELAVYSAAGLNPYTIVLAQNLCSRFEISFRGDRNIGHALADLRGLSEDYGKPGHLHNSVMRGLTQSSSGEFFAVVSSMLAQYYDESVVPAIFNELVKKAPIPEQLRPPMRKWQRLTVFCKDVVCKSDFGDLVDTYTWLGEAATDNEQWEALEHAGSLTVVEFFDFMSRLCRGDETSKTRIEIFAGKDAGFVTAVAEWLFDLKLILCGPDGETLYSNCGTDEGERQLKIHFQNPGVPCDGLPVEIGIPLFAKQRWERKSSGT